MAELKKEDFKDLTVKEFTEKLKKIESIDFLNELSIAEQADDDRKGIYTAISDRMEELNEAEKLNEVLGPESQPEGIVGKAPEESSEKKMTEEEVSDLSKANFIELVKEKRLQLDKILEFAKAHNRIDISPDNSIFLAKAWLGKLLLAVGDETPYKKDEAKEITNRSEIPATAETDTSSHFKAECLRFNLKDTFKAAIELRAMLQEIIDWLDKTDVNVYDLGLNARNANICRTLAFIHASEAKFFLGVILSNQKI